MHQHIYELKALSIIVTDSSLFGINIPLYIMGVFVLAYILWAKTRNKGVLTINFKNPDGINKVSEIFLIFISFLVTMIELLLVLLFMSSIKNDLNLNWDKIVIFWEITTGFTLAISCIITAYYLSMTYKKKQNKKNMNFIIGLLLTYHIIIITWLFGVVIWEIRSAFVKEIAGFTIFLLSIAIIIAYLLYILLLPLISHTSTKSKHPIKTIIVVLIITITCIGTSYLWAQYNTPKTIQQPSENVVMKINYAPRIDAINDYQTVEVTKKFTIQIMDYGKIGSYFNIIPIDYTTAGIGVSSDQEKEKFQVSIINKGMEKELIKNLKSIDPLNKNNENEFTAVQITNEKILLRFDRSQVKEKLLNITITGIYFVNITPKNYSTIVQSTQNENIYFTQLNISNSLTMPVEQQNMMFYKINSNASCHLTNVNLSSSNKNNNQYGNCENDVCSLILQKKVNETHWQDITTMTISIKNNQLWIDWLRFNEPYNLSVSTIVIC